MNDALHQAIDICGGQVGLARRLTELTGSEVSQQRISNILCRNQKVPAELAIPIERVTDGRVSRRDLRPDLYPVEDQAPASDKTEAA